MTVANDGLSKFPSTPAICSSRTEAGARGRLGRYPWSALAVSIMLVTLVSACSALEPSPEAVRAADRFYQALGAEDYPAIVAMCAPRFLADTPASEVVSQLEASAREFGPLVSRRRVSVFTSQFDVPGDKGTSTAFRFDCEYQRGRAIEALRVFEPADGGPIVVESYRVESRPPGGGPERDAKE